MPCAHQTEMQLPLVVAAEGSEANPNPERKSPLPDAISKKLEAQKEYHRKWRLAHMERYREYSRAEYRRNYSRYRKKRGTKAYKAALRAYCHQHRAKHPERHKAALKRYHAENPEYFEAYRKQYAPRRRELYQQRKAEICARKRELAHTEKYNKRSREYLRKKRKENVQFALADRMRATMNRAFRRNWIEKPARTEALLGCTIAEAKAHIETQFVDCMSWENRASFVLDHWAPVALFDLNDTEEAHIAFNWRNLRPITRHDNAVKSDTLPNPIPSFIPPHITQRIIDRSAK